MKKWITLSLIILLTISLPCTVFATGEILSLSDATGQEGDTVYLAVSLNESIQGNTIGVTYSYDSSLLQALPDFCSWSIKGLMQDFDYNNAGVWASSNTQNLSGTVCVLAFQLKAPLTTGTTVSCTMVIKDGSAKIGTYTAEATVSTSCEHQYSAWSDNGAIGHNRVCSVCGAPQTQSHTWDDGVLSNNPDNPFSQIKTFTCSVCNGTKSVEVYVQPEEEVTEPTIPDPTYPSTAPTESRPEQIRPTTPEQQKETQPTKPATGNTSSQQQPTQPPYRDYNQPAKPEQNQQSQQNYHVHSDGSIHYDTHEETTPIAIPNSIPVEEETHDHVHETQPPVTKQTRYTNMVLSVIIVGLMAGAGYWFLKKKRK